MHCIYDFLKKWKNMNSNILFWKYKNPRSTCRNLRPEQKVHSFELLNIWKKQRYFFESSSCSLMTANKQIRRNCSVGKCTWKQPLAAKLTVRLNWQEISNVTCLCLNFSHHINWHTNVLQIVFAPHLLLRRRHWFWVLSSRSVLIWNVYSNARL